MTTMGGDDDGAAGDDDHDDDDDDAEVGGVGGADAGNGECAGDAGDELHRARRGARVAERLPGRERGVLSLPHVSAADRSRAARPARWQGRRLADSRG